MAFDMDQPRHVRVKNWRLANNLSMAKAAKMAGLGSASAWQYYENPGKGDRDPPRKLRELMGEAAPPENRAEAALKTIISLQIDPALGLSTTAILDLIRVIAVAGLAKESE